jgi:hypothetical protein
MTFTRTSLPPVVRLGGSTDVPVTASSSFTTLSVATSIIRPTVVRIDMAYGEELQPTSGPEREVAYRRRSRKSRANPADE